MAGHSGFSDYSDSLQRDAAARCLSLVDARLDEMSDAREETSEGPFANFSKELLGMRSTLAPFSLSQLSLPTEEELDVCSDLSNVVPPYCLTYLEGDPVRSCEVSMNGCECSEKMVEYDDWIYPCAGALPMRFSWSLYFVQSNNEYALRGSEGIQDVSVMNDRTQP